MIRRVAYTEPGEIDLYQPHAHSQYFQTASELGLVGLLAGVLAFGAVVWLLIPALRGADVERRRWAWASVFGLVYLALNVVVDVHTIPTVALLMGLPIAVLDATSTRGIGLPFVPWRVACWLRNAAVVLLVLACSAAMLQLIRSEGTALTHQEAVRAGAAGEWADMLGPALEAARADPEIGVYQLAAATALAANGEWEAAEQAYRNVIALDDLPDAWLGLARAGVETGRPTEEIRAELAEALRLGEQQAALAFAAGQVYDLAGLPEEANAAYAAALALLPTLGSDEAWRAVLGDERFTAVVDGAIAADPEEAWAITLMAGDPALALELAAGQADALFYEGVIAAWGGDAAAYSEVRAMTDATPTHGLRLAYAAQLADHLGDHETAEDYMRLKRIGAHWGPATVTAGYGERDPFTDSAMGTTTHYYGTYTYRRAHPLDRLPPGLPGIVIVDHGPADADE